MKLGNKDISGQDYPFIVAEMSGNHNQSIDRALEIVDRAAECGVDAIKIQTYTADTMTLNQADGLFYISDKDSLWKGKTLYQLYREAYTPWDWHEKIFKRAEEDGIIAFSTPFDETAVDFLEELGVSAYKVGSFENADWQLLKKVAKTGKPIIMSTGLSELSDIAESVNVLKSNGTGEIVLLKCTSSYPASPKDSNVLTIPAMAEIFDLPVGLSDHTPGIGVALAAIALGARLIEKHFTIRRADGGVDSAFSMEPSEMKLLVEESRRASDGIGMVRFGVTDSERKSLRFKRSIYCVADIKNGERFSKANVRIIRPGDGLAPKFYDVLLGKQAKVDVPRGTPISWDMIL